VGCKEECGKEQVFLLFWWGPHGSSRRVQTMNSGKTKSNQLHVSVISPTAEVANGIFLASHAEKQRFFFFSISENTEWNLSRTAQLA
jgi:hypothetical protein